MSNITRIEEYKQSKQYKKTRQLGVRMNNEADFKRIFKQSIKNSKGFAMSLAAPMISGIPDLYVILPDYVPIMLEAKWLGEINNPVFSRKIPFSPLQTHWMGEIHAVNAYTAFGLIGFKFQDEIYAVLTPPHVKQLTYQFEDLYPYAIYDRKAKVFTLTPMLVRSTIPKISFKHAVQAQEATVLPL